MPALFWGDVLHRHKHQLSRRVKFQPSVCLAWRGNSDRFVLCLQPRVQAGRVTRKRGQKGGHSSAEERSVLAATLEKKGTVSTAKHAGKSSAGKCRFPFLRGSEEWRRSKESCR